MGLALAEAGQAASEGEVPIGAVLVFAGEVISRAHNRRETDKDATAHAEMLVIRDACRKLGRWRLTGATLYVTIEPCPMCAGALLNARVTRLIYGSPNPQYGAVDSRFHLTSSFALNHTVEVTSGILQKECQALVDEFFRRRRS